MEISNLVRTFKFYDDGVVHNEIKAVSTIQKYILVAYGKNYLSLDAGASTLELST
jgi:hypothetical protein